MHDRPGRGKPRTVRTPEAINAVRARIRRNPLRKREEYIKKINVQNYKIGPKDGCFQKTGHLLTERLKLMKRVRSK